jgi:hypothetical protein
LDRQNRHVLVQFELQPLCCSFGDGDRSDKVHRRTADAYATGQSDDSIVPEKRANKAGPMAAAERVEGRGSTKENVTPTLHAPDAEPEKRGMGRRGYEPCKAENPPEHRSSLPEVRAV